MKWILVAARRFRWIRKIRIRGYGSLTFLKILGSSTSGAVISTLCVRIPSSNDFINHSVSRRNFESIHAEQRENNSISLWPMKWFDECADTHLVESIVSMGFSPCGIWHSQRRISMLQLKLQILSWRGATQPKIPVYRMKQTKNCRIISCILFILSGIEINSLVNKGQPKEWTTKNRTTQPITDNKIMNIEHQSKGMRWMKSAMQGHEKYFQFRCTIINEFQLQSMDD